MSLEVFLKPEVENQLARRAREEALTPGELAAELLAQALEPRAKDDMSSYCDDLLERVRLTPERVAERRKRTIVQFGRSRSKEERQELAAFLQSEWPGEETEEELLAQEKRIDDEDSGRV